MLSVAIGSSFAPPFWRKSTASSIYFADELACRGLPPPPRRLRGRGAAPRPHLLPILSPAWRLIPRLRRLPGRDPRPRRPSGLGVVGGRGVLARRLFGGPAPPRPDHP